MAACDHCYPYSPPCPPSLPPPHTHAHTQRLRTSFAFSTLLTYLHMHTGNALLLLRCCPQVLGIWCLLVWAACGQPPALRLVELGPGRGTLMADLLRGTAGFQGFAGALEVHLVEVSPALRAAQWRALRCSAASPAADGSSNPADEASSASSGSSDNTPTMGVSSINGATVRITPHSHIELHCPCPALLPPSLFCLELACKDGYPCTSARLLCLPTCVLSVYLPTCACPPAVHWTATGGHCLPSHSQVHWHASLDHVPAGLPTLWLAHEFLDALPVHQFVRHPQRGWLEVRRRRCGLTPAFQPLHVVCPHMCCALQTHVQS